MVITGESKQVAAAYIAARSEIQTLMPKDGKAHHGRYLTLAAILETVTPILAVHDLVILQEPTTNEYGVAVATSILHESGASIDFGPLTMPIADHKPQTVGSAISYCRRYALTAVLGLAGDDDDGQAAQDSFAQKAPGKAPKAAMPTYTEDEVWDTPAQHAKQPDRLSQAQLTRLHILGADLYGSQWDEQRPRLVEAVSKGAVKSSKELTPTEADTLIKGMEKKLKAAQPQHANGKIAA